VADGLGKLPGLVDVRSLRVRVWPGRNRASGGGRPVNARARVGISSTTGERVKEEEECEDGSDGRAVVVKVVAVRREVKGVEWRKKKRDGKKFE